MLESKNMYIIVLMLALFKSIWNQPYSPTWQSIPQVDAGQFDIITSLTNTSSTVAAYSVTYGASFSNPPGLAYGILKYSCMSCIL
jgi:hypothetical protein